MIYVSSVGQFLFEGHLRYPGPRGFLACAHQPLGVRTDARRLRFSRSRRRRRRELRLAARSRLRRLRERENLRGQGTPPQKTLANHSHVNDINERHTIYHLCFIRWISFSLRTECLFRTSSSIRFKYPRSIYSSSLKELNSVDSKFRNNKYPAAPGLRLCVLTTNESRLKIQYHESGISCEVRPWEHIKIPQASTYSGRKWLWITKFAGTLTANEQINGFWKNSIRELVQKCCRRKLGTIADATFLTPEMDTARSY